MSRASLVSYRSRESVIYSRHSSLDISSPETLHYTLGKTLGSGTYAKVKAAWSPFERRMIAIKIVNKAVATKEYLTKFLPREISILQRVNHPNIIHVHRMVETDQQVYFMLELAENGDLLDYINTRRYLSESEARYVLRQISSGIAHCHSKNIVHRDLKCENIMLSRDMTVKIGDFGFARTVGREGIQTPCGSYSYAAPELFASEGGAYDGRKADIWSMGVILYAMVCGRLPFGDDSQVKSLQGKPLSFKKPLSTECKQLLVHGMLNADVGQRCDVIQLRISPWMRGPVQVLCPYSQIKHRQDVCLPQEMFSLSHYQQQNCPGHVMPHYPHTAPVYTPPLIQPPPASQRQMCSRQRETSAGQRHTSSGGQRQTNSEQRQTSAEQNQQPSTSSNQSQSQTQYAVQKHRPLKSRLGAAGRKIANAVLHHSHTQTANNPLPSSIHDH